jgi:hypothetical protein
MLQASSYTKGKFRHNLLLLAAPIHKFINAKLQYDNFS